MKIKQVNILLTVSSMFLLALHFDAKANYVILIGGGDYPGNSQASIESNTKWIANLVKEDQDKKLLIYFTNAGKQSPDVKKERPNQGEERSLFEPLARVYKNEIKLREHFYKNNINDVSGGTNSEYLKKELGKRVKNISPGTDLLLIYQGHGGQNQSDANKNYLKLWGRTKLTVVDLDKLLNTVPKNIRIRFVFPQCYSGGFSSLMYKDLEKKNGLADSLRCGYLAQSHDKQSEGCTSSINTADYRDYSNYFFSALSGKTRSGAPLLYNPDTNSDGTVSLREAHFYTLVTAHSTDFSRSTSEQYLEDWQPWYIRWLPDTNVKNEYSDAANMLLKKVAGGDASIVKNKINNLANQIEVMEATQNKLNNEIKKKQKILKQKLSLRWPAISAPYTKKYSILIKNDLEQINNFLLSSEEFLMLRDLQNTRAQYEQTILDLRRDMVQHQKYIRLMKLATIKQHFLQLADSKSNAEHQRLVQCEESRF